MVPLSVLCVLHALCVSTIAFTAFEDLDLDLDLTNDGGQESELIATAKEAEYYLKELRKSVRKLSSLHKRSSRAKRDDRTARGMQKTDFLFDSLLGFCVHIQDFRGANQENVTSADYRNDPSTSEVVPPSVTHSDDVDKEEWYQPDVRPVSVSALRQGSKVLLLFNVRHSVAARITRTAGFELEKVHLDKPSKPGSMSEAQFNVDTSVYCKGDTDNMIIPRTQSFRFEEKNKSAVSHVILRIDVCNFDIIVDESRPGDERIWMKRQEVVHENITMPKFQFEKTIPAEGIEIVPGQDESFILTSDMDGHSYLSLNALFYDRKQKSMIMNQYIYNIQGSNFRDQPRSGQLFSVEILNSSAGWGGVSDEAQGNSSDASSTNETIGEFDDVIENERIKMRVTLLTSSGTATGKVYITARVRHGTFRDRRVVSEVRIKRDIIVRKRNRANVYPRRHVYMPKEDRFLCNEEGNINREKAQRNCTLWCWAFGRDLQQIKITKRDSEVPIYRSFTYHSTDQIVTKIDLGASSPAIEGTYECTVFGAHSFKHTEEMQLFTTRFPKIDGSGSSVVDLGNGSSVVECAATGTKPMQVSLHVNLDADRMRVDDDPDALRNETETEDGLVLIVQLPTDMLRYPAHSISCHVSNDRGHNYHTIDLESVIIDYNLWIPKIVARKSSIVNYGNGTTAITCTATGKPPLNVSITIGGTSEEQGIDNEPGYIREENTWQNGMSVVLYADTRSLIRSYSWLYCVVRNDLDRDSYEFNLRDHIDWNLKYEEPINVDSEM